MSEHGSRPATGNGIKTIPLDPGLCRNITIHGYCKWAEKGCRFNHGEGKIGEAGTPRLRPDTPNFTPGVGMSSAAAPTIFSSNSGQPVSSIAAGAPVFVPRGGTASRE